MAYLPIGTQRNPSITQPNYYGTTAFGEQRVASSYTLADLVNKYEIDSFEYSSSTVPGGSLSHIAAQSAIRLTVDGTSGAEALLRTNTYFRYQAGKGLRAKFTGYQADTGHSNQIRRWGLFDTSDGVFFELNGTTVNVVVRSSTGGSANDSPTAKASWSYDKMDGTGPSGKTLDLTKGNIFEIDIQWLGVGTVSFFVNGYLVHQIEHAGTLAVPYMKTAQLPLSWQVVNSATTTGTSMTFICASVIVEGGDSPPFQSFSQYNSTGISVGTAEIPLLTIQPRALYNSITNRMVILPTTLFMQTESKPLLFRLIINASLTGASFANVDSRSGTEYDVSATAFSNGETIWRGMLPTGPSNLEVSLTDIFAVNGRKLRQNAFATAVDSLTVTAVIDATSGTTITRAMLNWKEIR